MTLFKTNMSSQVTALSVRSRRAESPEVTLWDLRSGNLWATVHREGVPEGQDLKALSYDGKILATSDAAEMRVWDISGKEPKQVGLIHAEPVAVGFGGPGGDEKSLMVVDKEGQILEWQPGRKDAKLIRRLKSVNDGRSRDWPLALNRRGVILHDESLGAVPVAAGGKLAVVRDTSALKVWEWQSGKELMSLGPMPRYTGGGTIRFSPDGGYLGFIETTSLGTPDGLPQMTLRVVKVGAGAASEVMHAKVTTNRGPVAVSSGAALVACANGSQVTVYRPDPSPKGTVLAGHDDQIVDLDIDASGGLLASASIDRSVRLWEPGHGRLLLVLDAGPARPARVALSPQGTWLAVGDDGGNVRFWNLAEARLRFRQAGLDWDDPAQTSRMNP